MSSSTHLIQQDSVIGKIQGVVYLVGNNGQQVPLAEGDVLIPGQTILVTGGSAIELIENGGETIAFSATPDTDEQFAFDDESPINLEGDRSDPRSYSSR